MTEVTKEQMDSAKRMVKFVSMEAAPSVKSLEALNTLIALGNRIASGDWVLVPSEPTERMMEAGDENVKDVMFKHRVGMNHGHSEHYSHSVYRAMLSAA
jgi:hypothetical protein